MKVTLFDLKDKLATVSAEIDAVSSWIAEKAAEPSTPMEDIAAKQKRRDELKARFDLIKEEHDKMEEAQRISVATQAGYGNGLDEKAVRIKAKADFYRSVLTGQAEGKNFEGLGGIPALSPNLGNGSNLLPINLSSELITEPIEENSLRLIEPVSQISGLIEPILGIEIDDASLEDITDKDTAREIETSADQIVYGRHMMSIAVTVKTTVLRGTDTNLVSTIESKLRSGIAIKEKMDAFRTVANGTNDHQSFYLNNIKTVTGPNIVQAIINAWADLPEIFAGNASCVMRKSDYFNAIQSLANGADTLWGKKPEDVIGIPVIFNDRAVQPVVGDFRFSRQNYDIDAMYATDMDAKKNEHYFVLTAWGDHRIRLRSAFRLVRVTP